MHHYCSHARGQKANTPTMRASLSSDRYVTAEKSEDPLKGRRLRTFWLISMELGRLFDGTIRSLIFAQISREWAALSRRKNARAYVRGLNELAFTSPRYMWPPLMQFLQFVYYIGTQKSDVSSPCRIQIVRFFFWGAGGLVQGEMFF